VETPPLIYPSLRRNLESSCGIFHQPILVIVSPTSLTPEAGFFTPRGDFEALVCGHGTLAAGKVIFDLPEVAAAGKTIIILNHVCGTAHGLLTPYWSRKLDLESGEVVKARQVSKRGGDLRLIWDKERSTLKLRGQCSVFAKGEMMQNF
jgi:predicted PhzF superfamily epimerase YddE/YHI9